MRYWRDSVGMVSSVEVKAVESDRFSLGQSACFMRHLGWLVQLRFVCLIP